MICMSSVPYRPLPLAATASSAAFLARFSRTPTSRALARATRSVWKALNLRSSSDRARALGLGHCLLMGSTGPFTWLASFSASGCRVGNRGQAGQV